MENITGKYHEEQRARIEKLRKQFIAVREKKGLTQQELAEQSTVPYSKVVRFENGEDIPIMECLLIIDTLLQDGLFLC